MQHYSQWEETARIRRELTYIDAYPEVETYRDNDLLRYLEQWNKTYHLERKTQVKQVNTAAEAETYAAQARSKFKACLGELPRSDAKEAHVTATLDRGTYRIDKIWIESLPGFYVSANFYYPKQVPAPLPAVLVLCGHALEGKAAVPYVSFCVEAVHNGMCVLIIDPLGQGERKHKDLSAVDAHGAINDRLSLLGEQLAQYMMLDNVKAVDYLLTRAEADPARIAVTGNSGGGNMSAYMGAYDDRISAIAPSCWITEYYALTRRILAQDAEQCLVDVMKERLDCSDLIMAAAPKPYMIGAALFDFFPIEGTRDAFVEAKRIYRLLGANDQLDIHVATKGHGYWHDTRTSILRFLCLHFDVPFVEDKGIDYERLPTEQELACAFDEASSIGLHVTISDVILARAEEVREGRAKEGKSQDELRASVAEVLRMDSIELRADVIEWRNTGVGAQASVGRGIPGVEVSALAYYSERGMRIEGTIYEKLGSQGSRMLLHIGAKEERDLLTSGVLEAFSAVVCVSPRGTGAGRVDDRATFGIYEGESATCHNAHMLGLTMQGMRVLDILAAIRVLEREGGVQAGQIVLSGSGEHAFTALYAAVLGGIEHVNLGGLPDSYEQLLEPDSQGWGTAVHVHGLLKKFDIEDLLATLPSGSIGRDKSLVPNLPRAGDGHL